jgi:hypothetical protein
MQDAANSPVPAPAARASAGDNDAADAADAATKARIIQHMNADHTASLARYLEFYCRLPRARAEHSPRLEDITFEYLILACGGGHSNNSNNNSNNSNDKNKTTAAPAPASAPARHVIPLDPPLTHWSQARARLVRMDAAALAGLARSATTVRRYRAPRSALHITVFAACVLTFAAFWRRANFRPGALLYDRLLVPGSRRSQPPHPSHPSHPSQQQLQQGHQQRWQQTATNSTEDPTAAAAAAGAAAGPQSFGARFAHFCYTIQPALITSMLAIHLAEAAWMHATRLRRYNVPLLGRVWWAWMLSTFIEGFGAFQRLDALVREEEAAEEEKKKRGEKQKDKVEAEAQRKS